MVANIIITQVSRNQWVKKQNTNQRDWIPKGRLSNFHLLKEDLSGIRSILSWTLLLHQIENPSLCQHRRHPYLVAILSIQTQPVYQNQLHQLHLLGQSVILSLSKQKGQPLHRSKLFAWVVFSPENLNMNVLGVILLLFLEAASTCLEEILVDLKIRKRRGRAGGGSKCAQSNLTKQEEH
jgi:hypothetical protein